MKVSIRRVLPVALLPLLLAAAGCDIGFGIAGAHAEQTSEWHKTYQLGAGGRVDVGNISGRIEVEASSDNSVDVRAIKKARAGSPEAAKSALERISIAEDVSASHVKLDTKIAGAGGLFSGGNLQVDYYLKVPASADVHFSNVNGGISVNGLRGRVDARTTNGKVQARDVSGEIAARAVNGGVDVDLARVAEGGVNLGCTNGAIKLTIPRDSKATISASIVNGGISTGDLPLETTESSRRHVRGRLNGGGPQVELSGTNGGISISGR